VARTASADMPGHDVRRPARWAEKSNRDAQRVSGPPCRALHPNHTRIQSHRQRSASGQRFSSTNAVIAQSLLVERTAGILDAHAARQSLWRSHCNSADATRFQLRPYLDQDLCSCSRCPVRLAGSSPVDWGCPISNCGSRACPGRSGRCSVCARSACPAAAASDGSPCYRSVADDRRRP
jgi:hypothetical protein